MRFSSLKLNKTEKLPKTCGVYCFKKNHKILYIGKAANIRERVKNHFFQPTYRDNLFINQVSRVGYIKTDSEIEALILEANLIKKYQPKYNVVWRDDKNYFYIGISRETFPRVFITHQPITKAKKSQIPSTKFQINSKFKIQNFKTDYVGPFVDGKALKQTLKSLRKVFPYRSCYKIPNRPCLWYHLNRCPAPCLLKSKIVKEIPSNSLKIKKISQKNAQNLVKILKEGKNPTLRKLKKEMKIASKNQDFEIAAQIRDQIKSLEKVISHAKIFNWLETETSRIGRSPNSGSWEKTKEELKKIFEIKKTVSRIEAYDVSNIQGQQATGSMVTFINGFPEKNFYRKFKIKISGKPNDVAMIKEVLNRRFSHPEWGFPDLILIDGGKSQLNAAINSLNQYKSAKSALIRVLALAKKENKLFIEGQGKPIMLKNLPQEIFNLILQLRDEAHRFARKYHLKLREIDLFSRS